LQIEGLEAGEEVVEFAATKDVFLMDDGWPASSLEEGYEAEEAIGGEAILDLEGKVAEEEHGADDEVDRAVGEGLGGEVDGVGVDREVFGAGTVLDVGGGDGGGIDGGDVEAAGGEPEGVAAEAGGDVEGGLGRAGGGEIAGMGEKEGLGVVREVAGGEGSGVAAVPGGEVGHGGRVGELGPQPPSMALRTGLPPLHHRGDGEGGPGREGGTPVLRQAQDGRTPHHRTNKPAISPEGRRGAKGSRGVGIR